MGLKDPDDCAVFRINSNTAIVQTVDFFTPIVDDPFLFGQIAVANSLSDVYAMGAKPVTALNLIAFPSGKLDGHILKEILRGGLFKMAEADVCLVGGHSIEDNEIKYGLSVTGLVHPKRILMKKGAREGDIVIVTKPIGTGIISTALKAEMASVAAVKDITESMACLNRRASEIIVSSGVSACTDITGFGLAGHAVELARASGVGVFIDSSAVPVFNPAIEYASMGLIPEGAYSNRKFYENHVVYNNEIAPELRDIIYDPQTSGGLFITVSPERAEHLMEKFKVQGVRFSTIGRIVDKPAGKVLIS